MDNKTNKIKEWVKNLKAQANTNPSLGLNSLAGFMLACDDVIAFIDSLEKEPEPNTVWRGKDEKPDFGIPILVIDCFGQPYSGYYNGINPRMVEHWAYIKDLVNCKDCRFENKNEMESDGLEEEISNYIKDNFFGSGSIGFLSNRTKGELDSVDVANIAHHFAEWQREKDIRLEKLDDLEKFAQKWAYSNYHKELDEVNCDCLYSGVIKGAEWQKQQMMKDAVEAEVVIDRIGEVVYLCPHLSEETGDKAKIIIVKEEQQ